MTPLPRAALLLTAASLACAAVASAVTLLWSGAFPTADASVHAAAAEARGWSAVTLALVVPVVAVALAAARRGDPRGRLVWLGGLVYLVYTYLELAVSPPFSPLYLVYVGAYATALPALVMGVATTEPATAALGSPPAAAPRRAIAAFTLLLAAGLALVWTKDVVARSVAGGFGWPTGTAAVRHVVEALDLGLQVPLAAAAGLLLLRRRPAGDLAAAMVLVNAVFMGTALTAMVAWSAAASGGSLLAAAPFALVPATAALLARTLLRAPRPAAGGAATVAG